jgi:hypothetical protein
MKHTEMIMVIEAHSEGKAIQCSADHSPNDWHDVAMTTLKFNFSDYSYRVKPAPKYKTITPASYLQESGCIDFSAEYVEIKALEDALKLTLGLALNGDDLVIYSELSALIK